MITAFIVFLLFDSLNHAMNRLIYEKAESALSFRFKIPSLVVQEMDDIISYLPACKNIHNC